MKKVFQIIIVLAMLCMSVDIECVWANYDDPKVSIELTKEEVVIGENLLVEIELEENKKIEINDSESSIHISNGKDKKEIKGLVQQNEKMFFSIPIDKAYKNDEVWNIINIILKTEKEETIKIDDTSKSFRIIDEEYTKPTYENVDSDKTSLSLSNQINPKSYIDNVIFENLNGKVKITADVSGNVNTVTFPTWSINKGQDDILWGTGIIKNNKVTYTVDIRDHNFDIGDYVTHIYVVDYSGEQKLVGSKNYTMMYNTPTISDISIADGNGYYEVVANVKGYDLQRVEYPTWTSKNGQDDLLWKTATIENDKVRFKVEMKDHKNETGEYVTHIYLTDGAGNQTIAGINHQMKYEMPEISNVQIENGNGYYEVTASVKGYDLQKVEYPTWTSKNGQDDLLWKTATIENGKVRFKVEMKDHKNETGEYVTHIYLTDGAGNQTIVGINHQMKYEMPEISNVQIEDGNGYYEVTANVKGYDLQRVEYPTWTSKNGQDDLLWKTATIENGKVRFQVEMKDHKNETGEYVTHIYLTDGAGNQTIAGINHQMKYIKPTISNVKISSSSGRYTITANVEGYNVKEIKFPTWSSDNGQDDIVWGTGVLKGNTVSYTVDFKDHNYQTGNYITHIYAYDSIGNYTVAGVNTNIINEAPIIQNIQVSDISSQGYLITCTVTDDYSLSNVKFPTWTSKNGQDDIVWGDGVIKGNEVTFRVYTNEHGYEDGDYITHIYAYDVAGKYSVAAVPIVKVDSVRFSPGWKIENGKKYLFDAEGKVVGQGMLVIDISEHNEDIDWKAVKNSGVDAVILRSSYGYCSDMNDYSQMDKKFKQNVAELNRLGIPYGIYHFSYATQEYQGAKEAEYLLSCLKEAGARPTLPIYYDLEYSSYVGDKSNTFYANLTRNFAEVIKSKGYSVGVYANNNWWNTKLTSSIFDSYDKWIAHYGTNSNNAAGTANPNWRPSNSYKMWQYTSSGKVSGINGRVDMNIKFNH